MCMFFQYVCFPDVNNHENDPNLNKDKIKCNFMVIFRQKRLNFPQAYIFAYDSLLESQCDVNFNLLQLFQLNTK